jgi:hypothetical protein
MILGIRLTVVILFNVLVEGLEMRELETASGALWRTIIDQSATGI